MRNLFFLILFFHLVKGADAQYTANDVNLSIGFSKSSFWGKDMIEEQGFIGPSLFNNFKNIQGYDFRINKRYYQHISFGLGLHYLHGSDWELSFQKEFSGSVINQVYLMPFIQVHTSFNSEGIYNRLRLFGDFFPVVGYSSLHLTNSLIIYDDDSLPVVQPENSDQIFFGIGGRLGLEISVSEFYGFYTDLSFKNCWVESELYPDKRFLNTSFGLGVFLKICRDKSYYY